MILKYFLSLFICNIWQQSIININNKFILELCNYDILISGTVVIQCTHFECFTKLKKVVNNRVHVHLYIF